MVEEVIDCDSPKGRALGVICLDSACDGGSFSAAGGGDTDGVGAPDPTGDSARNETGGGGVEPGGGAKEGPKRLSNALRWSFEIAGEMGRLSLPLDPVAVRLKNGFVFWLIVDSAGVETWGGGVETAGTAAAAAAAVAVAVAAAAPASGAGLAADSLSESFERSSISPRILSCSPSTVASCFLFIATRPFC